ncbi:hypothetical protein PQX77_007539, partial [Marasmius sp. AFHP31]
PIEVKFQSEPPLVTNGEFALYPRRTRSKKIDYGIEGDEKRVGIQLCQGEGKSDVDVQLRESHENDEICGGRKGCAYKKTDPLSFRGTEEMELKISYQSAIQSP